MKLAGTLVLIGSTAFAQAGFDGPGRYEIKNVKSGWVLDLDRYQTAVVQASARDLDATQLLCGRFDGTSMQQWRIASGNDGNALMTAWSEQHHSRRCAYPDL
ncbi:MAG: RICIN domain-containing protein [Bryobacteraceae bacterium]|jgi:hypothetical protein